MKIIAFVGLKQSGKSTACAYLEGKINNTTRVNFKDALVKETMSGFPDLLREIAHTKYCGNGIEQAIDDLFTTKPPLMRALMQNFGTEVRRKQDPEYWVKRWQQTAAKELANGVTVLTDDVRFKNEAQAVKSAGGILIRLKRTDMVRTDAHSSEVEQESIKCDYTITCGKGDHEILYRELDAVIETNKKGIIHNGIIDGKPIKDIL